MNYYFYSKNSLSIKFVISVLQCLQVWYCTYKIKNPVPLYRDSLMRSTIIFSSIFISFFSRCSRLLIDWKHNTPRYIDNSMRGSWVRRDCGVTYRIKPSRKFPNLQYPLEANLRIFNQSGQIFSTY